MEAPDATTDVDTASPVVPSTSPAEDAPHEVSVPAESSPGPSTEISTASSSPSHPSSPSSAGDTSSQPAADVSPPAEPPLRRGDRV
ncbi:unnamed protein product [Linum trigynum]|uniref:Uncharacterized protein n=1 Tax=Linum trigynum TaxID=586398 RepID=A0AAV2EBQ2_9ROSI